MHRAAPAEAHIESTLGQEPEDFLLAVNRSRWRGIAKIFQVEAFRI